MTLLHTITIPGQPMGKERPRASIRGGHIHMRSGAKTVSWTQAAILHIRRSCVQDPYQIPLMVHVTAVFERPKYMLAKKWPNQREPHCVKPDRDNVDKIALDALTKSGLIVDDKIVWTGAVTKWYADRVEDPHLLIEVHGEIAP